MPVKRTREERKALKGIVVDCEMLNIRKEPNQDSEKCGLLKANTEVVILEKLNNWYKISDGYVMADFIKLV